LSFGEIKLIHDENGILMKASAQMGESPQADRKAAGSSGFFAESMGLAFQIGTTF
jgi:hypothetical protein